MPPHVGLRSQEKALLVLIALTVIKTDRVLH